MHWYFLAPLVSSSIAICLSLRTIRTSELGWAHPVVLFIAPWLAQFVFLSLPIFNYVKVSPNWGDVLFLCMTIWFFLLGALLAHGLVGVKSRRDFGFAKTVPWKVFRYIGVGGVVGQAFVILNASASSHYTLYERFFGADMRSLREEHVVAQMDGRNLPLINTMAEFFLAPMAIVYVACFAARWGSKFRLAPIGERTFFVCLCSLTLLASLFGQGGRVPIAVTLVAFLVASRLSTISRLPSHLRAGFFKVAKKRMPPTKKIAASVFILCALWYLLVSVVAERLGDISYEHSLYATHRAELVEPLKIAADKNPTLGAALLSLSYFTTPTPTLYFYLDESHELPGPYYGLYNFYSAIVPLNKIANFIPTDSWTNSRLEVFAVLEREGFFGNPWATGVRDFVVDFRYLGSLVMIGIMGFISVVLSTTAVRSAETTNIALASIFSFCVLWFSFQSILYVPIYIMALIGVSFLSLILRLIR